jgi:phage gpG-like protein
VPIEIEVTGLARAQAMLGKMAKAGQDLTPVLEIAGSILEASTLRRFEEEVDPGGIPWPPSKAALGLVKRASGKISPGRTLFDTGGLQGSIRHETRPTEVEVGVDARTRSAKFGYVHQFGYSGVQNVGPTRRTINQAFGIPIPPKEVEVRAHSRHITIPKRSFLGVNEQDREDLEVAWRDHFEGLFGNGR